MIKLTDVTITSGPFRLERLSFEVAAGTYAALMGATATGKTTILEGICGLRAVESGRIVIAGRDVTDEPPGARGIGYVPQDAVLFAALTVRQQLALPLEVRGAGRGDIGGRIDTVATMVGITALLDRRPAGLSGGERQRVALARALTFEPDVLLLDEPLSALDEDTRASMYEVIERVREATSVTAIHVTHSRAEAERLGDVVLRLTAGAIETQEHPA